MTQSKQKNLELIPWDRVPGVWNCGELIAHDSRKDSD